MARMTLMIATANDRQSVILQTEADGVPLAHIILEVAELDHVIQQLGACRAQLLEEVTPTLDPSAILPSVVSPAWRVFDEHSGPADHVALALRHPGLGWTMFVLEHDRAQKLSEQLAARSKRQSPEA